MSKSATWGGVEIPAEQVITTLIDQRAPAYSTSTQTSRSTRINIQDYEIQTLHQGEGVIRGDVDEPDDIQHYQSSQGLIAHIQDGLFLPYILNTQTFFSLTKAGNQATADYTSNHRLHAVNTDLGQSALRLHVFRSTAHYRNVSDTDASLENSGLSLTNNVTSAGVGRFNSTDYLVLCTDGSTDDVTGLADPTSSPPAKSTLLSLSAGDNLIYRYMPNLGPGYNIFIGKYQGDDGIYAVPTDVALDTAPSQIPLTATTSETSITNPIESAGPIAPTDGYSVGAAALASKEHWKTPGYITADNASAAQSAASTQVDSSTAAALVAVFDFRSLIPPSCDITGIEDTLSAANQKDISYFGLANNFAAFAEVDKGDRAWNGSFTVLGANRASEVTGVNGTTYANVTVGGPTSMWAYDLTADIVRSPDFGGFYLGLPSSSTSTSPPFWDGVRYWTRKVYFRRKGDTGSAAIPLGGSFGAVDPTDQNTIYILAPEFQDDTGGINVPRIPWKLTFAYDANRQTPTVTIDKLNTGLANVENLVSAMGNLVAIGETQNSRNKVMVEINGSQITDLQFGTSGQGLTEDWGIVNLWPQGTDAVIFDAELSDNSVVQTWIYTKGFYHPIGKRQTITSTSLRYAGEGAVTLNPTLRNRYRFNPSGTNLTVARAFHPENANANPVFNYTSQTLESGPLSITLPELNIFGPEEAAKAILTARCLGRNVSATNTVKLEYSTDGGSTFTTWHTFTSFNEVSTLASAVAFQTLVLRISLSGDGTDTPNGLPLSIEGISQWGALRRWEVMIDPSDADFQRAYPLGYGSFWETMISKQTSSPIQIFASGGVTADAIWNGFQGVEQASDQPNRKAGEVTNGQHSFTFEELP